MQRHRGIGFATTTLAMGVLAAGSIPAIAQSPAADPAADWAATISGPVVLSGWQSSPAEGNALTQALLSFQAKYPNIKVDYQPIAGEYPTVMAAKFASRDVPDLFYVNGEYAQSWIDDGLLAPLNDYVTTSGFDTSTFFPGYADVFKQGDTWYGFPKDGNTIGMAYNTDLVTSPPATMADLVTAATALKGTAGVTAPMCLNSGLDRGLAFLYANGGELVTADGTASAIDTDASKAAVQAYLDLFKDGLGMTASDLGAGWCGEALGKGSAAIAFEGGWLDPYLQSTFPEVKYAWAPVPVGTSGAPVTISFTASYSIGTDSVNKDQAFALMSYLTGPEGMTRWTEGGVALPSRSDVPSPAGKEVLTEGSAYARPGAGFIPGFTKVQDAFGAAMTAEIQNKTYSADTVVAATKAAIDTALAE